MISSIDFFSKTARRPGNNRRQDVRVTAQQFSRHPLQVQETTRDLRKSPLSCPLGASPGRFSTLPAPQQPSGGARTVAAFPSQADIQGRYGACSLLASNLFTNKQLRFGKDNKSLHPIWSPVTAVARCSGGAATALPVAQTGELNRYVGHQVQP